MNKILSTSPLLLALFVGPTVVHAQTAQTVSAVLNSLGLEPGLSDGLANQGADQLAELLINAGVDPLEIVASIAQFGDQQDLVETVGKLVSAGESVGAIVSAAIAASPSASAGDLVSAAIAQVANSEANVREVVVAALDNGVQATDIASAVIIGNSELANPTSAIEAAVSTLVAADVGNAAAIVEAAVTALAYVATSTDGERSVGQLEVAKDNGQLENIAVAVNGVDEIVAGAVYGAENASVSDRDSSDGNRVLLTENTDSVVENVVGEIIAAVKEVSEVVFSSDVSDSVVTEAANGVFTRITVSEDSGNTIISDVVTAAAGTNEALRNELVADVQQTQPASIATQVATVTNTPIVATADTTTDSDNAQLQGEQTDTGGPVQEGAVVSGQSTPVAAPPPPANSGSAPSGGGISAEEPASGS